MNSACVIDLICTHTHTRARTHTHTHTQALEEMAEEAPSGYDLIFLGDCCEIASNDRKSEYLCTGKASIFVAVSKHFCTSKQDCCEIASKKDR